ANHLTGYFPAKQSRKRLVDLFQRDLTRDHLIEFQLAVQIHINVAWHVDTKTVRAHTRTLDFFLLQEVWTVQLNLGAYGNHADHRGRATLGQHIEGLLRGLFEADGFEGVFDPTTRQVFDLLHRITFRSIHEVCSTADLREFQLARPCVNGDDAAGPGDGSPLDGAEPDTAATDHGYRTPWGDFRGVDHRPNARGHATANERGFIKGHILTDLHNGVFMYQELFSIGGEIGELMHHFPALGEAWRLLGPPQGVHPVAEMRTACRTVVAMATEDGQTGNDVVPRLHVAHLGADGCDDTSGFVAEHDGGRTGGETLLEVQVAVE